MQKMSREWRILRFRTFLKKMYITLKLDEKEIRNQLAKLFREMLKRDISMHWIKSIIAEEIRKQVKIDIKIKGKK